LQSVGGDLRIDSNEELVKQLFKKHKKNKWYVTERACDFLCHKKIDNVEYLLNGVRFKREWFLKIKNDQLTPDEVFAIDNIEHRRIAYQFMDKTKMKSLKDFEILDRIEDDGHKHYMQIVSFTIQNMNEPLKFLNIFCPSTGREYYLGTNQNTCDKAKSASFGLDEVEFIDEW